MSESRRRGACSSACGGALLALLATAAARAQTGVQWQGIADLEGWATDTSSLLLRRNNGDPQGIARMLMWAAVEPARGFVVYGMMEAEKTSGAGEKYTGLQQAGVRYTPSAHLVLDAGRIPHPVGAFAARRFSTRNPLIGEPDIYPVEYPYGAQVSGAARWLDYRAAMVDEPVWHERYTPDPSRAWRPAVGVGVTPYVGVHVGVSYTEGPYLNETSPTDPGKSWRDYRQRVLGADAAASIGYLELRGEFSRPSYDAPTAASPVRGTAYYAEGKYTLTPRVFVAARLERNEYPFIQNFGGGWIVATTDFHDQEAGIGYRLTPTTLVKTSYRRDHWRNFAPQGGHAFAVQLSQSFDVVEWIDRLRNGAM